MTKNTDTSTNNQPYNSMTHEEAMALPIHLYMDRCIAWLNEFNEGKQLKINNPNKCPIHIWVMHNHKACSKDLVPNIINCPICDSPMCPGCFNHEVTQLSRVTGYIQAVDGWNAGKKQELLDRKKHNTFE